MKIRLLESLTDVGVTEWDAISGPNDPFSTHAFLSTLEASGSVGQGSGWHPLHVTVWDDGPDGTERLVGALPLYAKEHSYGEYIFDWGWADAAMRMGRPYYPKLVAMAPVTPATGRRMLLHPDAESDREEIVAAMLAGAFEIADQIEASSIHFLFVTQEERDLLLSLHPELRPRLTMQFHWHNEGWTSFDAYLASFKRSARRNVVKERRRVRESGLEVRMLEGEALDDDAWQLIHRTYRDTASRKYGRPYLTREFFKMAPERLRDIALAAVAYRDDTPVAATLNFERGTHLYGRYWGCLEDHEMLHFELCYYQLIERAIARGVTRFEAGAQGSHKLKRGLMPARIHSVHWLRDKVLRDAVNDFLIREAGETEMHIAHLTERGPFKRPE
ncbi:MAG: GNAT family N-acetyltransferase [Sandaracinaceae bacterium]